MEKTDLVLPDVIPIVIRREYRQNDANVRGGEYGKGQSFFYQMMLAGDFTTFSFADLVLANGAKVHYRRTSPGTDKESAVMEHTGTAGSPVTPTGFYASVLRWNAARPGWDLTFTDRTIYQFHLFGHRGNPLTGIQDRAGQRQIRPSPTLETGTDACRAPRGPPDRRVEPRLHSSRKVQIDMGSRSIGNRKGVSYGSCGPVDQPGERSRRREYCRRRHDGQEPGYAR